MNRESKLESVKNRGRRLVSILTLGTIGLFGTAFAVNAGGNSLCDPNGSDSCPVVTDENGSIVPDTLDDKVVVETTGPGATDIITVPSSSTTTTVVVETTGPGTPTSTTEATTTTGVPVLPEQPEKSEDTL